MTPFLRKLLGLNWLLLANMLALAIFGVIAIYSATYMRDDSVASEVDAHILELEAHARRRQVGAGDVVGSADVDDLAQPRLRRAHVLHGAGDHVDERGQPWQ